MTNERSLNKSWIKTYINDYIVLQESPDIFHMWVAISLISTVLKRKVFIDRGAYLLYPNFYIVLIAESGIARKSGAVDIGLDLLDSIDNLFIISGKATPEGLSDAMNHVSYTPDGRIIPDGSILIHSDELSELLGKATYTADLASFLMAIYSCKNKIDFATRGKGLLTVRNPYLNIVSATTPEQLGEIISASTMRAGLAGRMLFIHSAERPVKIPKPKLNRGVESDLINDLKIMSNLYGVSELTLEAEMLFDDWYMSYRNPPDSEIAPFGERKHDHILKTALILSIAESNDLIIRVGHIDAAIAALDQIELLLPSAFMAIGSTNQAKIGQIILRILAKNFPEPMSHSVLLRRVYKHVENSDEFRKIMKTLDDAGKIESAVSKHGESYKLIQK